MSNCWIETEDELATVVLPNLSAFQSFCGVGTAAAALPYIKREDLPSNYALSKWAIVSSSTKNPFTRTKQDWLVFDKGGVLTLRLGRNPITAPRATDILTFKTQVGDIIDEIISYTIQNGGIAIREIAAVDGPFCTPEHLVDSEGDKIRIDITITWLSFES